MSDLKPTSFTITISPEDIKSIDNFGFEVTQRHMEIAAELMQERAEEYFIDDMFNAILSAYHYAEDEKILGT